MPTAIRVIDRIQDQSDFSGSLTSDYFLKWNGSAFVLAAVDLSGYALLGAANTFATGPQTLATGAAGTIGCIVQGAAAQTANLMEWRSSAGTVLSYINSDGNTLSLGENSSFAAINLWGSGLGEEIRIDSRMSNVGIRIGRGGVVGGSFDVGIQSPEAGVLRLTNSSSGAGKLLIGTSSITAGAYLHVAAAAAATKGLIVQGAASQTANLTEWQNSSAVVLASVSAAGLGLFAGLSITEATDVVLGTTTGTKIGTAASQKLGFWNATPIIQPASANQAALSLDVDVTGADTVDKAALNTNLSAIQTLVNQLRSDLVAAGLIKGSA